MGTERSLLEEKKLANRKQPSSSADPLKKKKTKSPALQLRNQARSAVHHHIWDYLNSHPEKNNIIREFKAAVRHRQSVESRTRDPPATQQRRNIVLYSPTELQQEQSTSAVVKDSTQEESFITVAASEQNESSTDVALAVSDSSQSFKLPNPASTVVVTVSVEPTTTKETTDQEEDAVSLYAGSELDC